jgi:hypothetical protein
MRKDAVVAVAIALLMVGSSPALAQATDTQTSPGIVPGGGTSGGAPGANAPQNVNPATSPTGSMGPTTVSPGAGPITPDQGTSRVQSDQGTTNVPRPFPGTTNINPGDDPPPNNPTR